jgi:ABC-type branched-subunit amino acid transport system substrate-binding protein
MPLKVLWLRADLFPVRSSRRQAVAAIVSSVTMGLVASVSLTSTGVVAQAAEPSPSPASGGLKIGLLLTLSGAQQVARTATTEFVEVNDAVGAASRAMRNAAEMAVAELGAPNVQLLIKDDAGNGPAAKLAAQRAIDEGAEILLGPIFAHQVPPVAQIAHAHQVPVIALSSDRKVASRGVYLLSYLPEADIDRVIGYAISQRKRSFVGIVPTSKYGDLVGGIFRDAVSRGGGHVMGLERYESPKDFGKVAQQIAKGSVHADALFIPEGGDAMDVVSALSAAGLTLHQTVLLGTQSWDNPKMFSNPLAQDAWYAGPDPAGFRSFAARYRSRYHEQPPRAAALAYEGVMLIAALAKTQRRITDDALTSPVGFAGVDGILRFRGDGTIERGLAVLRVTSSGPQVISPALRRFGP